MDNELMIKIDNVSKEYRLGAIGGTTLREDLQRTFAKLRKKEDPTLKIGQSAEDFGKKFMALNGVSFEVKKGEAVGIIGHNGAGKSTLLKLLSRVTAPSGGTIGLNGRVASMLEVGTGFHGELTGRENVYMNGAILGMTKAEIDRKMEQIIEFSECRQFIDTPVKRYSSGMYVKLAFSVAAHLDSEIMIMDEVLAVGDMAFQMKCLEKMRNVAKKEGRTVLYVSHNMNTIRQLCDRCVVLSHGEVTFDGDVEEAIGIYMNNSKMQMRNTLHIDCRDEKREGWVERQPKRIRVQSMDILDKGDLTYYDDERITCKLTFKTFEPLKDVGLRFEYNTSTNIRCGACVMSPQSMLQMAQPGIHEVTVTMDIGLLVPGEYFTTLVVYRGNSTGETEDLECIRVAFNFSKEDLQTDFIWNSPKLGHIRMPDICLSADSQ